MEARRRLQKINVAFMFKSVETGEWWRVCNGLSRDQKKSVLTVRWQDEKFR